MNTTGAAALVVARAPRPDECLPALVPQLGPEGCAALQTALVAHAARWAAEVAPARAAVAFEPPEGDDDVRALVEQAGVRAFAQVRGDPGERLTDAIGRAFADHGGPLLLADAGVPRLSVRHAAAALSDLDDGCDVTLGPTLAGRWYLIGLREPQPALFDLAADAWGASDVWTQIVARAQQQGLRLGLLQAERSLTTPGDARAFTVDPATPPEVARLLRQPTHPADDWGART